MVPEIPHQSLTCCCQKTRPCDNTLGPNHCIAHCPCITHGSFPGLVAVTHILRRAPVGVSRGCHECCPCAISSNHFLSELSLINTIMVTNNAAFDECDDTTQGTNTDGQDPLSLLVRCKHVAVGTNNPDLLTTQFCATIQASAMASDQTRAPVDIVVALDVSASMHGEKLKLCKETVQRLLTPRDRFGLVTFYTARDPGEARPCKSFSV
jgi:hypothetical protein